MSACPRGVIALARPGAVHAWPRGAVDVRAFDLERPSLPHGEVDVLIHLAAHIPASMTDASAAEECLRLNAIAVRDLLQACGRAGVAHVVLASTGALYANHGTPAGEDDAVYPANHAPYYLASKLAAEVFARAGAEALGIGLTVARIGSVYGPGMKSGVVTRFIDDARHGRPHDIRTPHHTADLVYVDDVAAALLACATRRLRGTVNVGSGVATSIARLASVVDAVVAGTTSARTADDHPGTLGFPALDISRARHELDFDATPLATGLARIVAEAEPTPGS